MTLAAIQAAGKPGAVVDKFAQTLTQPSPGHFHPLFVAFSRAKNVRGRSPKTGRLRANPFNRLQKRPFKRVDAPAPIQIRLTPKMCGLESAFCNILPPGKRGRQGNPPLNSPFLRRSRNVFRFSHSVLLAIRECISLPDPDFEPRKRKSA